MNDCGDNIEEDVCVPIEQVIESLIIKLFLCYIQLNKLVFD